MSRRSRLNALGTLVMAAALSACSSSTAATGTSPSAETASSSTDPAPTSSPTSATSSSPTWNGVITGSDQMKIGTDYAYAAEIHVTCSGSPPTPTATLETTEGWKATTTSPANGFGPSPVTLTSPAGKSVTLAGSTQEGPIWNTSTFSMIFSRDEQVGSETWRLWLGKVSCLGG